MKVNTTQEYGRKDEVCTEVLWVNHLIYLRSDCLFERYD
jgi:hypothetical protein